MSIFPSGFAAPSKWALFQENRALIDGAAGVHLVRILLISLFILTGTANARVIWQWRGPDRNGIYPETGLLKEWPADGPALLWKTGRLGTGFSSAAVTPERVYVTGMLQRTGNLFAFDHDGELVWVKRYGPEWHVNYPGSRNTPTIVDGRLYIESGMGAIYCMNSENGAVLWSVDILERFGAKNIAWGMNEMLLADGDRIYCTPGGPEASVAALNRFNGETIWVAENNGESAAYCSPILVRHNGLRLLITQLQKSIIGINADSGELLWRHAHESPWDIKANTPIYHNGQVYFQTGEGGSGQLLQLSPDGTSVKKVWENWSMDTLKGHQVLVDGYIYGAGYPRRGFQALNWNSGESQYEAREFSRCNVCFADGRIYAYNERGVVGLITPNPEKFDLISSFEITDGSGPHWAHLVIADKRLYVRHGEVMRVYDLSR